MTNETSEEEDVALLVETIREARGVDLSGWERAPLASRARERARTEGDASIAALARRAKEDGACLDRALWSLTIEDAPLFSAPSLFRSLRERVAPLLRTYPYVNVWYAGCGTGEGAYATAIALREEGLHARVRIYATDVNERAIARANEGTYAIDAVAAAHDSYRDAGGSASLAEYYTMEDGRALMRPLLRYGITFVQHDLASDESLNEFQLVIFRGLFPRFGRGLRERARRVLDESMCRFGIVALDAGEEMEATDGAYHRLEGEPPLYRRAAT